MEYNFGSSWWTLTHSSVEWMLDYLERHEEVLDFFDNSICPDESLFQSLFMKTPYTNTRENIKVYLDWTGENRHPKTLTINDYDTLMNSDFLIARKFDEKFSKEILKLRFSKDESGKFHYEKLIKDKIKDKSFEAKLLHFSLDEEDFVKKATSKVKVETSRNFLELIEKMER